MASRVTLEAYEAIPSSGGRFSVLFNLSGKTPPLAPREVEVKNTADALAALDAYKKEAAATGLPLAVALRVAKGYRAPAGFKAATANSGYHGVNI